MKILYKIILSALFICQPGITYAQLAIRPGTVLPELELKSSLKSSVRNGNDTDFPTYIDNSLSPYFPAIINQHGGSCAQASGVHYLFTYEMNRVLEREVASNPKENTFSYRYTWNFLNEGKDNGSHASDGVNLILHHGCVTEADYGDEDEYVYRWVTGYSKYYNAMHYKVTKASSVNLKERSGIEKLMQYMIDKGDGHPGGGIASFSLTGNWDKTNYDGPSEAGIEYIMVPRGSGGSHAMTLIGYDLSVEFDCDNDGKIDDDEKGAFIFVNSWGTWWATGGKAYMPFSGFTRELGDGGFYKYDSHAEVLCIETAYHEPTLTMEINMTYDSRNDLTLSIGVADGIQENTPKYAVYPVIVKAQGGDLRMQGTNFDSGKTIEMGFDISELKSKADEMKAPCWFFTVYKTQLGKNGTGKVNKIAIHDYSSGQDNVISQTFIKSNTIQVGSNKYKLPTKEWYMDNKGNWFKVVMTPANKYVSNSDYLKKFEWNKIYGIRKANGGYAKIKFTDYNPQTGKVKFSVNNYEYK